MSPILLAREGRSRQRYENHYRLVSGCIPYRLKKSVENSPDDVVNRLEVLMISSPNREDLVFPKGGWEDDETVCEAACREALEEAGVRGIINEKSLGEWKFRSKSRQHSCSLEGTCKGYMFALEVTEELDHWPEKTSHERRWVSVEEALRLCRYDWMREALYSCVEVLSGRPVLSSSELSNSPNFALSTYNLGVPSNFALPNSELSNPPTVVLQNASTAPSMLGDVGSQPTSGGRVLVRKFVGRPVCFPLPAKLVHFLL